MKRIIKNTAFFAGANIISFFITAFGGFFIAKILGPKDYGGYSAYKLFISYAINLQLGILQGLQREIPFLKAQGKKDKLNSLLNSAFSFTFLTSLIAIVLLFSLSFHSSPFFKKVFIITLPLIPFFFFKEFYRFSMRGLEKFRDLSFLNVFDSVNVILTVIILALIFKGEGAVFGFALSNFVYFLIAFYITRIIFFKIRINFDEIKSLFKVGFPIFAIGVLNIFIFSVDRIFILGLQGRESYGIYAIAMNFMNLIYQIPIAFSLVLLPYLTRKKVNEGSLSHFLIKNDFVISLYLLAVSLIIFVFYPATSFVILKFLPKYTNSLPILKLLLSLILFPTLNYFFYSFLIAENKHLYIIPYHLILLPLSIIINSILIPKLGLKGAAFSFIISQFFFTLIVMILTYRYIKFKFYRIILPVMSISILHFLIFEFMF